MNIGKALLGSLTWTLFMSGCEVAPLSAEVTPQPYWLATPSLPARPRDFCARTSSLLRSTLAVERVKCSDSLAGAYGIRGTVKGAEIVILQGAAEEWRAFAHVVDVSTPARGAPSDGALNDFLAKVEAALRN